MQDYIDIAEKNGVTLQDHGRCQFCGAKTERGVHECLEIFNLGFQEMDYANVANHIYRFLIVDAHTLQHPEIHGRWNNHFHLTRLHLIFNYEVHWTYERSPRLSDYLNKYKVHHQNEYLHPPKPLGRGKTTTTDFIDTTSQTETKDLIRTWAQEVYDTWSAHHDVVDKIARGFLNLKKAQMISRNLDQGQPTKGRIKARK